MRVMARTTIVFALVLIVIGVAGYVGTGAASVTALIPAFFGVVLGLLGWWGLNDRYRKHALHAAVVVGVLGFLGAARGLPGLLDVITGQEVERPAAVAAQSAMAVLMALFVGMCLRSFIDARRARGKQVP
jgi:hypothetical protein